jgi:hypothetical protein
MKIKEVKSIPQNDLATDRVVLCDSTITVRNPNTAATFQQTKAMLKRTFGDGNVLNIAQVISEDPEITEAAKTLRLQKLPVKAVADKAEDFKKQY